MRHYNYGSYGALPVEVQTGFKGPEIPEPMRESPGKDAAELVSGFIGDVQGIACKANELLDVPFDATIKIPGPHRAIQGALDTASGTVRGIIDTAAQKF
jgi:hypothetical protein